MLPAVESSRATHGMANLIQVHFLLPALLAEAQNAHKTSGRATAADQQAGFC
jgi:hypothetical protein